MKTSIYLPDDLAGQVRAHGISISEVTQAALRRAVRVAVIRDSVVADIQAVAERLRTADLVTAVATATGVVTDRNLTPGQGLGLEPPISSARLETKGE